MGDWVKDNKGAGSAGFNFIEQPDKWGYLNNPEWTDSPHDEHVHEPCGHWHKRPYKISTKSTIIHSLGDRLWYQQSVDVYMNDLIVIAMRYIDDSHPQNGIAGLRYNLLTKEWHWIGSALGGWPLYGEPNTARRAIDFSAYYGSWGVNGDDNNEYMRLHIFHDNGTYNYVDLWTMNYPSYSICRFVDSVCYNVMDIHSSGMIACLAYLVSEGGIAKNCWAVKVSIDKGVTWKNTYYFPATTWNNMPSGNIRIDELGVIWVAYLNYTGKTFHIYKSDNSGDSWSLIHSESLGGTYGPYRMNYSVNPDGEYQYLTVTSGNYVRCYRSLDSGITWTYVDLVYGVDSFIFSSNDDYVVGTTFPTGDHKFKRSIDTGDTWNYIIPPAVIDYYYQDQQAYSSQIVYTECGETFIPAYPYIGVLYSEDNGATWEVISTPFFIANLTTERMFEETTITVETVNEPIIWPFDPQKDKPHYNEGNLISNWDNPVWAMEEGSNLPITPVHNPWCGYWTKNYVPGGIPPYVPFNIVNFDGSPATDTILRNGVLVYKAVGEGSPSVTWSVSAGTGSILGGSTITQEGVLTAGPTSCGSLMVTASSPGYGTVATQYVRVTNAGQWISLGTCTNTYVSMFCNMPSLIWSTYAGNLRYYTKTLICHFPCSSYDNKTCDGTATYIDPYCQETTPPGYFNRTWFTETSRWEC